METLRLMDRFSNFICSNEKRESICIRALLYQVYHLALHDKWDEAVAVMEQFRLQVNVFIRFISLELHIKVIELF